MVCRTVIVTRLHVNGTLCLQTDVTQKAIAVDMLAPASRAGGVVTPSRKLHIQAKARHHKDVKDELMATSTTSHHHVFNL